jgi:predicted NAD/FAD-dependent oxidoreductase
VHCGDYLGAPFTEGAVESGLWAAMHMLRTSDP